MKIVLLSVLTFIVLSACAQQGYEDVVYLKNGSVVHGIIIEQVPNISIKIQNRVGDVFFYVYDDIAKLTKEQVASPSSQAQVPYTADTSDYFRTLVNIDIGGLFGINGTTYVPANGYTPKGHIRSSQPDYFQATVNLARRIRPRIYVGGGLGFCLSRFPILAQDHDGHLSAMVPAYADVRFYILPGRHTPYLAVQGGAAMYTCNAKFGAGGLLAMQFGGRFSVARKLGLNLYAGYRMQHIAMFDYIAYTDKYGQYYSTDTRFHSVFSFFQFGGGLSF